MSAFTIILTRDVTESVAVRIDANDREQAEASALDLFFSGVALDWKKDDGLSDPYITGIDQAAD
ncbi:MAG: hypothetical protein HZA67_10005 [Rhodospirillales bacterium]|nr:hypothetical protein [Rhodospirillales bacterium]